MVPTQSIGTSWQGNAAQGIALADGSILPAEAIVANIDVTTVYQKLLPSHLATSPQLARLTGIEPSCSGFILLLGVTGQHPQLTPLQHLLFQRRMKIFNVQTFNVQTLFSVESDSPDRDDTNNENSFGGLFSEEALMESSIPLFSVRGITIRMHITFPLILIWGALQFGLLNQGGWPGAIFGLIVTLLLFAIVVLHELGHSMAALHYGVPVRQIVLLPIGGVAELGRMPEKPIQEFVIAIAGPLVNFGLAIVLAVLGLILGQEMSLSASRELLANLGQLNFATIFGYVFISNLFLGIFNLLPAFPMDGGRVLRALLATQLDYRQATAIAASIGQGLAWLMGLYGFLNGGFFAILIAIFIFSGASAERQLVEARSVLGKLTVGQAYTRNVRTLNPQDALREAIRLTFNSFQSDFPICDGERLVGLLTYTRLLEALDQHGADIVIGEVMLTDVAPVSPGESMFAVQQRLADERLDALPVTENGRFLGLITNRDISEIYRIASTRPELVTTLQGSRV